MNSNYEQISISESIFSWTQVILRKSYFLLKLHNEYQRTNFLTSKTNSVYYVNKTNVHERIIPFRVYFRITLQLLNDSVVFLPLLSCAGDGFFQDGPRVLNNVCNGEGFEIWPGNSPQQSANV